MAGPYVSSREGRFSWMMQRVSAVLLIFLAFLHFGIQHFTEDAVSTGLTVVARMNDPFWQAYYAIFVLLAMYHGINGLIGICLDYAPKPLNRSLISLILWSLGGFFGILGLVNIVAGPTLAEAKSWYAEHGFGRGSSTGSPPSIPMEYDLQREASEVGMLGFYLKFHVGGVSEEQAEAILGDGDIASKGRNLIDWARTEVAKEPPSLEHDRHGTIFLNSWEFAHWLLNVRRQNAQNRLTNEANEAPDRDRQLLEELSDIPGYRPF